MCGGFASSEHAGTYRQKLGRFTPSQSKKGLPDILATYRVRASSLRSRLEETPRVSIRGGLSKPGAGRRAHYLALEKFKKWFDNL